MTKPINDFSDVKVGDLVTALGYGHGFISKISDDLTYPINVEFADDFNSYTVDGKSYHNSDHAKLFKGHVELEIVAKEIKDDKTN